MKKSAAHKGEHDACVYVVTSDFARQLDLQLIRMTAGTFINDEVFARKLLTAGAPIERTESFLRCPCCGLALDYAEATLNPATLPSAVENATRQNAAHRRSLDSGAAIIALDAAARHNAEQRRANIAEAESTKVFR